MESANSVRGKRQKKKPLVPSRNRDSARFGSTDTNIRKLHTSLLSLQTHSALPSVAVGWAF